MLPEANKQNEIQNATQMSQMGYQIYNILNFYILKKCYIWYRNKAWNLISVMMKQGIQLPFGHDLLKVKTTDYKLLGEGLTAYRI